MISNKIKGLLSIRNKKTSDVCECLEILDAAFYRKLKKNTFKAEELIKVAELTNTKLAFIDGNNNPVVAFDKNDIKKDPSQLD